MSNKKKKRLDVVNNVVQGITCFSVQSAYGVSCQRKGCSNWINYEDCNNCAIVAAYDGPRTLQDVGQIFNLTRMRICQIEKSINKRIKDLF